MTTLPRPATTEDVRAIVAEATASRTPLAPVGHGTKSGLGHPLPHPTLDLSALSGVLLYEPEELVLSVRAGTTLAEVTALLDAAGQEFAFEPPRRQAIWGEERGGTVGGMLMTALSGPRRLKAGAVRDHVLGVTAVSGRGEIFKAGGRVVKNVTGYDLAKALAGSFGTLAVVTEVTLKVMPKAETEATLLLTGLSDARAVEALCAAMAAPVDVSGAAHCAGDAGRPARLPPNATLIRLEGVPPSVDERFERLAALLRPFGRAERLDAAASAAAWSALRDGDLLAGPPETPLWRVSVAPTAGPSAAAASGARPLVYDWSGGLVWLAADAATPDAGATAVRAAVAAAGGGHATLMRASTDLRARVPVFQPSAPAVAALSRRLKAEFDPAGILNPGRMAEGL